MQALSLETIFHPPAIQSEKDVDAERILAYAETCLGVDTAKVIFPDDPEQGSRLSATEKSLAGLVVGGNTVIAVPDVIFDQELARGGDIRGFIGVPIRDELDVAIGALCVMTQGTRIWSRRDRQTLSFLGQELETIYRMRAAVDTESRRAAQQQLIAREYHHRIRNAFSVSSAVVVLTGAEAKTISALVETTSEQLAALADAHTVLGFDEEAADLGRLVSGTLHPYKFSGAHIEVQGPKAEIAEDKVVSISLILNELATNSTKYGALRRGGDLNVRWAVEQGELVMEWVEMTRQARTTGTKRAGSFGGAMIDVSVAQLQATMERNWLENGLEVRLRFPV